MQNMNWLTRFLDGAFRIYTQPPIRKKIITENDLRHKANVKATNRRRNKAARAARKVTRSRL